MINLYICNIQKNTYNAQDFETHYMSQAIKKEMIVTHGNTQIKPISYNGLKSRIEKGNIKWMDVKYREFSDRYELFIKEVVR